MDSRSRWDESRKTRAFEEPKYGPPDKVTPEPLHPWEDHDDSCHCHIGICPDCGCTSTAVDFLSEVIAASTDEDPDYTALHDAAVQARSTPAEALLCEGFCGDIAWTVEQYGYPTHKHGCPRRNRCQSHPDGCSTPAEALDEKAIATAIRLLGFDIGPDTYEEAAQALIEQYARLRSPESDR
jgi:hypothetical protein